MICQIASTLPARPSLASSCRCFPFWTRYLTNSSVNIFLYGRDENKTLYPVQQLVCFEIRKDRLPVLFCKPCHYSLRRSFSRSSFRSICLLILFFAWHYQRYSIAWFWGSTDFDARFLLCGNVCVSTRMNYRSETLSIQKQCFIMVLITS